MPDNKLWFSLFTKKEYQGTEPPFVDINHIKGVKELENNYLVILKEFEEYLENNNLESHFNNTMVEKPETWKVQGLRGWTRQNYSKQRHFPKTVALLNAIPNITTMCFNVLEPHAKIKPHQGDTNAIIRCHLGLKIPATSPVCQLTVKGETKDWQAGKVIAFIDAYTHQACNLSNEPRLILLFDIIKPKFIKQKSMICATVRTSFSMQRIGNVLPGIYNMNRSVFKFILRPYIFLIQLKLPLFNAFRYIWYNKLAKLKQIRFVAKY
jgi:ornithine lipid ester-linked acyl 2-hydroxylase